MHFSKLFFLISFVAALPVPLVPTLKSVSWNETTPKVVSTLAISEMESSFYDKADHLSSSILDGIWRSPNVKLAENRGVIVGRTRFGVEEFLGIPFAEAPLGDLRFKHPMPYNSTYNNFKAVKYSPSCMAIHPLSLSATIKKNIDNIPKFMRSFYLESLNLGDMSEDCLHLNIFRPKGVSKDAKLPVILYIFGGAYQFGSTQLYPGNKFIKESMKMDQPVIFVAINYRMGPWGFLGGKGILNEGSSNAGLLDQRRAMEWVSDNIEAFGGNPNKITVMGESAGAISIAHHLVANDGNLEYNGRQLFHSVILQSGGAWSFDSVTSPFAQNTFAQFAKNAGCLKKDNEEYNDAKVIECLRKKDSKDLLHAQNFNTAGNSIPPWQAVFGWSPRYDGKYISNNPMKLISQGKFAKLPTITGNQEDEGTFLTLLFDCFSTKTVNNMMHQIFQNATQAEYNNLVKIYPEGNPDFGSPYRTSISNDLYPGFKRFASIVGDIMFHAPRRLQLENISSKVPRYVFQSTTLHGVLPFLGTMHASELLFEFYLDIGPSQTYRKHFISFANHFDPNVGTGLMRWEPYTDEGKETLNIGMTENKMSKDIFPRDSNIEYIMRHPDAIVI